MARLPLVNARRVASILRAVRVQLGLRQVDVAAAAHVSQSAVSRVERGRLGGLTFDQVQRIGDALRVSLFVDARWLDGDVDRLIDRRHAAVVEVVVAFLRRLGWEVVVEYGFNHFGERGSVDVLAWHAQTRTLLIVEVKSRLTDLQATFTSIATKLRIVPMLVRRDLEWDPIHVARLIVLPGTTANRSIVARHAATFASLFPAACRRSGRGCAGRIERSAGCGSYRVVKTRLINTCFASGDDDARPAKARSGRSRAWIRARAGPGAGHLAPTGARIARSSRVVTAQQAIERFRLLSVRA